MPGDAPTPLQFAALRSRFQAQRALSLLRGLLPTVLLAKLLWWTAAFGGASLILGLSTPAELLDSARDWIRSPPGLEALKAALILVVFWALLPLLAHVTVDHALRRTTPQTLARRRAARRRARRSARWWLLGFALLFGAGVVLISGSSERPWPLLAAFTLMQAPLLAGLLASLALFTISGRRLRCARCGYELGSWAGAAPRCPECGRDWKAPWGARAGARVCSWRLLASAAAVFALSLAAALLLARAALL